MESYADLRLDQDGDVLTTLPVKFPTGQLSVGGVPVASGGSSIVDFTAVEDIPAYTVVTSTGEIADSSDLVFHYDRIIGIVDVDVALGDTGHAITIGELSNPSWSWSPGTKLFLNGTSLSASPPSTGFSQLIAIARTTNIIIMKLSVPIRL